SMQYGHLSLNVCVARHIVWISRTGQARRLRNTAMSDTVSLPKAMMRGFAMKCPNCGRGHLFGRFLKVADHCEVCGESYTAQRADDFPAYLVIVVVGTIVCPAL